MDHQGRYVSHAVAHHHRRKRSTEDQDHDLAVHFRLRGLGQDFHLDLQPSRDLIAPSFTVQTLGRSGTKSLQPFPQDHLCFYHGVLRSEVNSSVALSTCAGMVSGSMGYSVSQLIVFIWGRVLIAKQVYPCINLNPSEMWKMYTALTPKDLYYSVQIVDNDGDKNRPERIYLLRRERKTHNLKHFWQELKRDRCAIINALNHLCRPSNRCIHPSSALIIPSVCFLLGLMFSVQRNLNPPECFCCFGSQAARDSAPSRRWRSKVTLPQFS